MRFDAYAGTVRERSFVEVAEAIGGSLGGILSRGSARRRYGDVLDIDVGGRQAAWVGLDSGNGTAYFEGKGETSPQLAQAIRVHFPEHTVARVDVCEDYDDPEAFGTVLKVLRKHKGPRVYGGWNRLSDEPEDGRTYEAGQRGGVSYVRLYEAGKMADRAHLGRPNWARLELECRPHYARDKRAAAVMAPLAVWGFSAWAHRVAEVVAQIPVPRFVPESRSYSADRTTVYLARTFRRHWEELLSNLGDWECVGRELAQVWADDDALEAVASRRNGLQ